MGIAFVVREMSWYKRRIPKPEPKPVSATVDDFQKKPYHDCEMVATYDDGNVYTLNARCHHNDIKDVWSIQGLDNMGHSVVVDVVE